MGTAGMVPPVSAGSQRPASERDAATPERAVAEVERARLSRRFRRFTRFRGFRTPVNHLNPLNLLNP
jgi:hypothetical protein